MDAAIGTLAAGRAGARLDTGRLRRWFAALVVAVALFVLTQVGIGIATG